MQKVFILGAQRSGTSKLASYFKEVLKFRGYGEGHIYRFVSYLDLGRAEIIRTVGKRGYEVNRIGMDFLMRQMVLHLDALISAHHGNLSYYDKTPGYQMIDAARLIHLYIPEARFIHIHRNGIDNVASQHRIWPTRHFAKACEMWARAVASYLDVRPVLGDRLLELTMIEMSQAPWEVHRRICGFLAIEHPASKDEIEAYFSSGSVSSTRDFSAPAVANSIRLSEQAWSDVDKQDFVRLCGPGMKALEYPID